MLRDELYQAIRQIPAFDVHSHLCQVRMPARRLEQVVFYHMIAYALRAAGVPADAIWPRVEDRRRSKPTRDGEAWQHLPSVWDRLARTSFGWILRTILRDLYEFDEPITRDSIPRLRDAFERKTAAEDYGRQVMARGPIARIASSRTYPAPLPDEADTGVRHTLEKAPLSQAHEWISWGSRIRHLVKFWGRTPRTYDELCEAMEDFFARYDWGDFRAWVHWTSSQCSFEHLVPAEADELIARAGDDATIRPAEWQMLEALCLRAMLQALRQRVGVVQLCWGSQYLSRSAQPHPLCRSSAAFADSLGHLCEEFPEIHFNLLNGYESHEPALCALPLAYDNVSLGGFWWHTFYRSVMHNAWHRRLDMVPTSALCGFFSDGYCIEWVYGRLRMTQRVLSNVLAEKIERGFYSEHEALNAAREILLDSPARIFAPDESPETIAAWSPLGSGEFGPEIARGGVAD